MTLNNEDSLLSQQIILNLVEISRRNLRRAPFWLFQKSIPEYFTLSSMKPIINLHRHCAYDDKEVRALGIVKTGDFRFIPPNVSRRSIMRKIW